MASYVRNSGGRASSAANRSLTVPWSRPFSGPASTRSKNFLGDYDGFEVELMGIEPTASRVRFTLYLRNPRGERKPAFPRGGEKALATDGGTIREAAPFSLLSTRVRSSEVAS